MTRKWIISLLTMFLMLGICFLPEEIQASKVPDNTVKTGWVQNADGTRQYRREDGSLVKNDWLTVDGKTYRFDQNGEMYVKSWYQDRSGTWYWLQDDGTMLCGGWLLYDKVWYYLNEDGSMKSNEWFTYDGNLYNVKSWGGMRTGWYKENGKWYNFQSWGGLRRDGWYRYDKCWYYLDENGVMKSEEWMEYDNCWYYFKSWGGMYQDEWLLYDKVWYYFKSWGGAYQNEWLNYDGSTYFFKSWCGMVSAEWWEIGGNWYYFLSWGGMQRNAYVDGYYVNADGIRQEKRQIRIAIDAGHQLKGNSDKEPIGPGSTTYKAKVASGTCGNTTGINEYELNLEVALKVRDLLLERGYEVYMIRETHDVDISNKERAQLAAENGADILVRIHANSDSNQSVYGALTMAPSDSNPYLDRDVIDKSQILSDKVINSFCAVTGAKNRGILYSDTMSGINWCTIPVTIVEMGFMSNPSEDRLMATEDYRNKMAKGIADGIDAYYAS